MGKLIFRLGFVFTFVVFGGLFLILGPSGMLQDLPLTNDATFVIPKGTPVKKIAHMLHDRKIIDNELMFLLSLYATQNIGNIKAGEYLIPQKSTPHSLAMLLGSGQTVKRKFTVVEGATVAQILTKINTNPVLTGQITDIPAEGLMMPETYSYVYGEHRQDIINRMVEAMKTFLMRVWDAKLIERGIMDPQSLLTMASIVEKETGIASERPTVAAVFLNRLRKKMRLQSDPTTIYALTFGRQKLNRPLTKDDLKIQSPYNTYVINGLPQGPIACPGKESIMAVLNPAPTNALYFVADGTGGHQFSESLSGHNKNVRNWRETQKRVKASLTSATMR